MRFFEIDEEIDELLSVVDPETGELPEDVFEKVQKLAIHKEKKIEYVCMKAKEIELQEKSLGEYIASLKTKRDYLKNSLERTKKFLQEFDKGEYGQFTLKFSKSKKLVDDGNYNIMEVQRNTLRQSLS